MAQNLRSLPCEGRWLVVDDAPEPVVDALGGAEVQVWRRRGAGAVPWPADGPFRAASVRLPREREALAMLLEASAARLEPGGTLYVYGANEEGVRSAGRTLERLLGAPAETLDTRRHCRVWRGRLGAQTGRLRGELADWRLEFRLELAGECVELVSYPGVFAHGRLDSGSGLLIEALPPLEAGARVLDFGCGIGVVARALRLRTPGLALDATDVDALAVEAARENLPAARVRLGDGWAAIPPAARYDLVVSNPPRHRGVAQDLEVLRALCEGAPAHLRPGGTLLLVTRRALAVAKLLAGRFRRVELAKEDARYRVWRGVA
jgi:16S rRNA (guanine1207-N2)-methyltransferase